MIVLFAHTHYTCLTSYLLFPCTKFSEQICQVQGTSGIAAEPSMPYATGARDSYHDA